MLKDRDLRQRTVGFISVSFLTHCGLIAAAFLTPNMLREVGSAKQAQTYLIDAPKTVSASLGETAEAEPPAQVVAPKAEVQPIDAPKAVLVAKNDVKPVDEVPQAKHVVRKSPVQAKEKAEAATKRVLALPTKKSSVQKVAAKPAQATVTVDQSEVEIKKALNESRNEEEQAKPEVAADIQASEQTSEQEQVTSEAVPQDDQSSDAQEAKANEEAQAAVEPQQKVEPVAVESATTAAATEETETKPEEPKSQKSATIIPPIQRGGQSRPVEIGGLVNSNPAPQAAAAPTQGAPQAATTGAGTAAAVAGGTSVGTAAAGLIRDADSLMEEPGNIKPTYPIDDEKAGRQGTVVFDAMVTRDGAVQSIQLRQSSGYASLDSAAFEAFRQHRYLPGQEGMVRKKFQFVLNGEKVLPSRLRRR